MERREVVALALASVLLVAGFLGSVDCQLSSTFYSSSCPNADTIVKSAVSNAMQQSPVVGPGVLRLFAHDCFVDGCDGSILIQDSSSIPPVERDANDNQSLQQLAFDTVNQAKAALESQCPGVVSCADILSMAAENAVNNMGGPSWNVLLGRRDGLTSTASSVAGHLPMAAMTLTQLTGIFTSIGLSGQDVVTLSGAHTTGFAHCGEFVTRLYGFNTSSGSDPSLAPAYAKTLQGVCPQSFSSSTVQALDFQSPNSFDNKYFQDLQIGQGLLFSDQVLYVDPSTTSLVTTYANNQAQFFTDFVTSMIAMSQVGVLTGGQGEIRLNCASANSNANGSLNPSSNSSTTTASGTPPIRTPPVHSPPNATTPRSPSGGRRRLR